MQHFLYFLHLPAAVCGKTAPLLQRRVRAGLTPASLFTQSDLYCKSIGHLQCFLYSFMQGYGSIPDELLQVIFGLIIYPPARSPIYPNEVTLNDVST